MSEEVRFIFSMEDRFSQQAQQAERSVGALERGLGGLGGVVATAFSVGAVVSFEKSVIDSYSRFEQFQASLTTMFKGNRQEAELLTGQLQDFAKSTPFELTEIQDATKMMLAYGSVSGTVVNEMKMLGDISSGVGAPLKDIAYLYGTLRTQGRAYMMDIRQFAGRGIPIYEALSKSMGVSKDKINDLVEKGKVGFPQVEKALRSLTEQGGQFAGMMDMQSKTLGGQISNLGDAWEQLKVSIGESQSGILKSTVSWATEYLNTLNEAQRRSSNLAKAFGKGGVKEYNFFGQETSDFSASGRNEQFEKMNEYNLKRIRSAKDELDLAKLQIQYTKEMNNLLELKDKNIVSPSEFLRTFSVIKYAKEMAATTAQQMRDAKKAKAEADASGKVKEKESHKVKATQYTNITININELVHDMEINHNTINQGAQEAGQIVLKALTEAVVDAQIVAGTK